MLTGTKSYSETYKQERFFSPECRCPKVFLIFLMPEKNSYQHKEMLKGIAINLQGIIFELSKGNTRTLLF